MQRISTTLIGTSLSGVYSGTTKISHLSSGSRRECGPVTCHIVFGFKRYSVIFKLLNLGFLQEPIAAALFGTCVLRGMAEQIPTGYKAVHEDFEHNANELEQLATGVLLMLAIFKTVSK